MNSFNNCRHEEKKRLAHPADPQSLYANKIIDNQTANRRCYEKNPNVNIVEGFGFSSIWTILVWIVVIVVVFFIGMFVCDNLNKNPGNVFDQAYNNLKSKIPFSLSKPKLSSNATGGFTEIMDMFK